MKQQNKKCDGTGILLFCPHCLFVWFCPKVSEQLQASCRTMELLNYFFIISSQQVDQSVSQPVNKSAVSQ